MGPPKGKPASGERPSSHFTAPVESNDMLHAMLAARRAANPSVKTEARSEEEKQQQQLEPAPLRAPDFSRGIHFHNKQWHLRGSVSVICGGFVYLEMQKVDAQGNPAEWVSQTTGPYHRNSNLQLALQQSRAKLVALNAEQPEQYTNRYVYTRHPAHALVSLDADFTQNGEATAVLLDVSDLRLVLAMQWGAKRLSDGCCYAVTDNAALPSRWLHDLLTPPGRKFVRFADGDTLNCSRANLITTDQATRASERIQVNADPPSSDGKYKFLNFESGRGKYPHGRWRLQWSVAGKSKSLSVSPRGASTEARESAKQVCLAKRAELIALAGAQKHGEPTWIDTHPDAADAVRDAPAPTPGMQPHLLMMPNAEWKHQSHANGFRFGSFLRGHLSKHGRGLWCLKQRVGAEIQHEHFQTEEAAMAKLLELNSAAPYSINSWQRVDERTRKIMLEGGPGDEYMLVDEEPEVVDALSLHAWVAEPTAQGGFEARNANTNSRWQRAIDLMCFLALSKRGTNTRHVETPEEYFLHFDAKPGNDPRDLSQRTLLASYRK